MPRRLKGTRSWRGPASYSFMQPDSAPLCLLPRPLPPLPNPLLIKNASIRTEMKRTEMLSKRKGLWWELHSSPIPEIGCTLAKGELCTQLIEGTDSQGEQFSIALPPPPPPLSWQRRCWSLGWQGREGLQEKLECWWGKQQRSTPPRFVPTLHVTFSARLPPQ